MKKLFSQSFALIKQHKKAFIIFTIISYCLLIAGTVYAINHPEIVTRQLDSIKHSQNSGSDAVASKVKDLYQTNPNFLLGVLFTFTVNFFLEAVLQISLPSLIIPLYGMCRVAYKLYNWGAFNITPIMYPITILEGFGYILAAFGGYVFSVRLFMPKRYGLSSHKEGFIEGLKALGKMQVLVIAVLLVAAITEMSIVYYVRASAHDPFAKSAAITAMTGEDSLSTSITRSTIYYDKASVTEADVRVAGVFLEDINYLRGPNSNNAHFYVKDGKFTIQLGVPKTEWNNKKTLGICGGLIKRMKDYHPNEQYRIMMIDADSLGNKTEKVFEEKK